MLFGLDYAAWSVGPKFMGVKLIPPGLHYVYCSARAHEDIGISRTGFFLYLRPRDVSVFRWDPEAEARLGFMRTSCRSQESSEKGQKGPDEEFRYADGARSFDFDRNLGPYPLELQEQWGELTRHATAELVSKVEPVSGRVRSKRSEYDTAAPRQEEGPQGRAAELRAANFECGPQGRAPPQSASHEACRAVADGAGLAGLGRRLNQAASSKGNKGPRGDLKKGGEPATAQKKTLRKGEDMESNGSALGTSRRSCCFVWCWLRLPGSLFFSVVPRVRKARTAAETTRPGSEHSWQSWVAHGPDSPAGGAESGRERESRAEMQSYGKALISKELLAKEYPGDELAMLGDRTF
ncbi:unnamed protein product [Symbiodinium pilosum]|uniref:AAR2 N-terminal domain-containing protein n=1 Tax=Symbiodinium pilosum TaxID=2952 RepID=A0A812QAN3_SYMPI|nr:unnamed protein product [Symbiodinium pilosum]